MNSQTQLILSSHLHVIFGPKRIEEKFSEISLGKLECHRGCKSFLGGSAGKESACNAGDLDSIPGLGRSPGEGKGYPVFWPGEFHGLSRPWSRKELDTPERLSLSLHFLHDLAFEESQVKGTWTDRKHGPESSFKLYSVLRNQI